MGLDVIRFRPERRGDERDFGLAPDYRAALRTVRVLDRNDSHRSWFRAEHDRNGLARLGVDKGNARSSWFCISFSRFFNELQVDSRREHATFRLRLSE